MTDSLLEEGIGRVCAVGRGENIHFSPEAGSG